MIKIEANRQDIIETGQADRFDFDNQDVGNFRAIDGTDPVLAFTVRRCFDDRASLFSRKDIRRSWQRGRFSSPS